MMQKENLLKFSFTRQPSIKNPNAVVFHRNVTSVDNSSPFTEIDFLKLVSEFQFELIEANFSAQIDIVQLFDQSGKQVFSQNLRHKKPWIYQA